MKKILIAEDDSFVSRMYQRAFKIGGYEVETVEDGVVALEKLRSSSSLPDVVIADISMPKLNGLELLKFIKDDPKLRRIPVVVLTNSFLEDDQKKALSEGADLFLVKIEHSSKEIVRKVDELIDLKARAAAAAEKAQ